MGKNKKKSTKTEKPFCLLTKRPELRAESRAVTLLRTQEEFYGRQCFATKKWVPGKAQPIKGEIGEMFQPYVAAVEDIRHVANVLGVAAQDPRMFLVHGAVKEQFVNDPLVNRRSNEHADKAPPCFEDVPRHTIPVDLDAAPEPESCNYLEDPERAVIEAIRLYLPQPFHDAAFCYEYSSSAGFPGKKGLRVHLYFFSERPFLSAELNAYFEKHMPRFPLKNVETGETDMVGYIDLSLYQAVHICYIAAPVVSPKMTDPLAGRRRGLVIDGRALTVALPEVADIKPGTNGSAKRPSGEQPSDEQIQELLDHCKLNVLDNDKKKRRDAWFQIGCALKTVYAIDREKGFRVFDTWAKQYDGYGGEQNSLEQWGSFEVGRYNAGTLFHWAGELAKWKPSKRFKEAQDIAAARQIKAAVEETQNSGWLYCVASKQFYCENPYQRLDKDQFSDKFAHLKIKYKSYAEQCLADAGFPRVDAYTFDPRTSERFIEEDGLRKLNLYRPNIIEAQPGDVQRFLDHAEYILPDKKQRHILLQTMAFRVQRPGEKIKWALILYGKVQRTGKSYFGYVERKIHGQHNVRTVSNERLHEPWTDWQEGTMLVIVEELKGSGSRYEVLNKLKPMIVEPITSVRYPGGRAGYDMPNRYNFLMFTNHQDALPLELSDQRYCVLSSPAERKPSTYYAGERAADGSWIDGLWDWTDKNLPAIKHYLDAYSLEGFDYNGEAPRTQAFFDMVERNESDLVEWLKGQIENKQGLFACDIIVARHVLMVLPPSLRNGVGKNKIVAALESAGAKRCAKRAQLGKFGYLHVFSIRNHDNWNDQDEGTLGNYYLSDIARAAGNAELLKGAKDLENLDAEIVKAFERDGRVFEHAVNEAGKPPM